MTAYNYSLSVIVPAAHVDAARRMLWALGRDTVDLTSFPFQVSADGSLPASGYGLHATVDSTFIAMLNAAHDGSLPDVSWETAGTDAASIITAIQAMTIVHLRGGTVSDTFPEAMRLAGMQFVSDPIDSL